MSNQTCVFCMHRAQAAKTDDPELKREILNTLEVLDSLIPRQIQAAKEATMDPDNEFKRKKLEEVFHPLSKITFSLCLISLITG